MDVQQKATLRTAWKMNRFRVLMEVIGLLGMACYWPTPAAPASNATPEVLVVVVTATGEQAAQPPAANTVAATSTSTMEPSPTNTSAPTNTPTNTLTPTPDTPMATADKGVDVNCRYGPGAVFAVSGYFMQGQAAQVYGRSEYSTWVQIQDPKKPANKCWVDVDFVSLNMPLAGLTELPTPEGFVYELSVKFAETEIFCPFPKFAHFSYLLKVSGPATVKVTATASWSAVPDNITKVFTEFGKIEGSGLAVSIPAVGTHTITFTVTSPNSITRSSSLKASCP